MNNRSLSSNLLDGIMRFVGTHVPTPIATPEEPETQFIAPDSAVGRAIDALDYVAQSNFVQGIGELSSGLAQTGGDVMSAASIGVTTLTPFGSALYAYSGLDGQDDAPV